MKKYIYGLLAGLALIAIMGASYQQYHEAVVNLYAYDCTLEHYLTLDDGSGASPSLIFTDGSDETVRFNKADSGYLSITTLAADGVQVSTGNLKVGAPTIGTLDGIDFGIQGNVNIEGTLTLDDGSGASPNLVFQDQTNETATFNKGDAGYLGLTTDGSDGLNILAGNLKVGNGTPSPAMDGEDGYVEGTFEVGGNAKVGGTLTVTGNLTAAGNILNKPVVVNYNTTTSARSILASETGYAFVMTAVVGDPAVVTFMLPDAAAGLSYTFVDIDVTAVCDLTIDCQAGDKINNGDAGKTIYSDADAFQSITLLAIDTVNWVITSSVGTWTAEGA